MSDVIVDYEPEGQKAKISVSENCSNQDWSALRRLFEERSVALKIEVRSIILPWWEFIAHRDGLKFIIDFLKLNLIVSNHARQFLLNAKNNESAFQNKLDTSLIFISENEVNDRLSYKGFKRQLLPYQSRNVCELLKFSAGATFSVPGAGKTTEALAFYFLNRVEDERLLIVAPKNAFVAWEEELPACVGNCNEKVCRLLGGLSFIKECLNSNPKVSIISYHQLPFVIDELANFIARNNVCLILDESHRMKRGHEGTHGSCLLSISHLPRRKLILSGTPVPNSKLDLVAQFNFLYPEIRTSEKKVIDDFKGLFVRTTKGELCLPPVCRIVQPVEMSESQRRLYEALAKDTTRLLHKFNPADRLKFRSIGRSVQYLLQVASNPALLSSSEISKHSLFEEVIAEGLSNKIKEACRLARGLVLDGKKVLIWSGFRKSIEHLSGLLSDLRAEFIHGGVETDEDTKNYNSREAIIRRFNDPSSETRVLIANPAACSEGISLHRICHHAIYLDRNYNAAQYLQSEDRIHRIGLPKSTKTFITILSSKNTIDDSVARRLNSKVNLMSKALNDRSLDITPSFTDEIGDGLDESDISDLQKLLKNNV